MSQICYGCYECNGFLTAENSKQNRVYGIRKPVTPVTPVTFWGVGRP